MLHQKIEAWTAQQLTLLFQVLLLMPEARQEVDGETLAWELALLLLRLAEIPLEEPDAVVAVSRISSIMISSLTVQLKVPIGGKSWLL
jgi:hypothetical protein